MGVEDGLKNLIFDYLEQIKELMSPELWGDVLLDCSKNEILILMLLYRKSEVNMTQIAEYIGVPLNTATGIVARMEKKQMISRRRNEEDKRVVTITFANYGEQQFQCILNRFIGYGEKIMETLTMEEIRVAESVLKKAIGVLKEERTVAKKPLKKKVKKIVIE